MSVDNDHMCHLASIYPKLYTFVRRTRDGAMGTKVILSLSGYPDTLHLEGAAATVFSWVGGPSPAAVTLVLLAPEPSRATPG